ncbi:hypothetical protein JJE66_29420 [Bradyrhizobium diazoefficiens]|uniref:hypothetical protein n=1 Tax=Bradyrhizobium diazoefficiens TaxID=1355477 RepID=UPI00190D4458|nr:hypothetical protein [Bradyrhizobium diazoefficiens]MBK3665339.1 hypothetical protein [Bradyrhizobium diazoefficiens]
MKDFHAICDGKTDAAPAFAAFNKWAVTQTALVQLTIPSGSVCAFTTNAGLWWAKGIKNLLVVGYGATITNNGASNPAFFLGGRGQIADNLHSARLATVAAGSSKVQLLTPKQASAFTVGSYALITGFDLQGIWQAPYGYPSNPHWFEYVKVTSVDASAGTVTFAAPLKNTYKSTWPNYNSGSQFEVDAGGPATLYALDPSWDTQVEYRGLTISQEKFQTYAVGRSVTYRDVKFTGYNCGVPTQNYLWQAINTDMSTCNMEVDKLITSMVLNGVTINQLKFQSSSTDLVTISSSIIKTQMTGTPKKAVISDTKIADFRPGAFAYGRTDEVICTNCVISSFSPAGVFESGFGSNPVQISYAMSNGVITFPNGTAVLGATNNGVGKVRLTVVSTAGFASNDRVNVSSIGGTYEANGGNKLILVIDSTHIDLPEVSFVNAYRSGGVIGLYAPRWAVPGTNLLWVGAHGTGPIFKVLDVTQDQNFTYIKTDFPGSFPAYAGAKLAIRVHPAPKFTCSNCSGSTDALDLSNAPAGAPLYSYSKRTYSALTGTTPAPRVPLWGPLKSAKFNVTTPYSGTGSLQFQLSQFNNWPMMSSQTTIANFGPGINMAVAGERTVTLTGVTGMQSLDKIGVAPNPGTLLGPSNSGPTFSAATQSSAQITVELMTDQRISQ